MARGGGGARGRRQVRRQVSRSDRIPATPIHEEIADPEEADSTSDASSDVVSDVEVDDAPPAGHSYSALLQSFGTVVSSTDQEPRRKRRKVDQDAQDNEPESVMEVAQSDEDNEHDQTLVEKYLPAMDSDDSDVEHDEAHNDPYTTHFDPRPLELKPKITGALAGDWQRQSVTAHNLTTTSLYLGSLPLVSEQITKTSQLEAHGIKAKLQEPWAKINKSLDAGDKRAASQILNYRDMLYGARTVANASNLRKAVVLHTLNHIYKGRDRVLKNSEKIAKAPDTEQEFRDQGFTRPKVLMLLETRQACYRFMEDLTALCGAAQQENKKRFQDSFSSDDRVRDEMPEDYKELFDGNRDDNFKIAVKLTRKTIKYFSAFYAADIILASPLGLRSVIENNDPKKSDYDFLSSIEVVIVDQADAMLMQNWDHVEYVFAHLNLQPKEAHGCDFSRVRTWYLDNQAKYLRQTIMLSGYLTPDLNRLLNSLSNIDGKLKIAPSYDGAILASSGLGFRQTFSRFNATSPETDPDERFAYFTSAVVPTLERIATSSSSDSPAGVLVYVPSYLDFVRVRNFLQSSSAMQNVACGSLSEYDAVSDARRARSHFLSGRHAVLLYSERAHHFNRYRIRGVKRVVFYAPPENPIFFEEVVAGYLGTTLSEGHEAKDLSVRVMFSKFDGLRLERVVGSDRVKGMLVGRAGDTFDFV